MVTNSLRLRGYKVQSISKPKSVPRQILEMTPRLLLSGGTLAILIAVSIGWLQPTGKMPVTKKLITTYGLAAQVNGPVLPGALVPVEVSILDPNGKSLNTLEEIGEGGYVRVAIVSRDLTYFSSVVLTPANLGGSGDMMGAADPNSTACRSCSVQPKFIFPGEGQYILFAEFQPVEGDRVNLRTPLKVGSDRTPVAELEPDASLVRPVDGIQITLNFSEPLKANRDIYLTFDAVDSKGNGVSQYIQKMAASELGIVSEDAETYINPSAPTQVDLQYLVNFPKPGLYKLWFSFQYRNNNRLIYIVEVK